MNVNQDSFPNIYPSESKQKTNGNRCYTVASTGGENQQVKCFLNMKMHIQHAQHLYSLLHCNDLQAKGWDVFCFIRCSYPGILGAPRERNRERLSRHVPVCTWCPHPPSGNSRKGTFKTNPTTQHMLSHRNRGPFNPTWISHGYLKRPMRFTGRILKSIHIKRIRSLNERPVMWCCNT